MHASRMRLEHEMKLEPFAEPCVTNRRNRGARRKKKDQEFQWSG